MDRKGNVLGGLTVIDNRLLAALGRLKVETGSLACVGCEFENGCSVHGCAIIRAAQGVVERFEDQNGVTIRMLAPMFEEQ